MVLNVLLSSVPFFAMLSGTLRYPPHHPPTERCERSGLGEAQGSARSAIRRAPAPPPPPHGGHRGHGVSTEWERRDLSAGCPLPFFAAICGCATSCRAEFMAFGAYACGCARICGVRSTLGCRGMASNPNAPPLNQPTSNASSLNHATRVIRTAVLAHCSGSPPFMQEQAMR